MTVVLFRTTVLYLCVIFAVRIMGKRQIADMQPNELVVTLLISEIAAIPLQDASQPLLNGITAIFILVSLEVFASIIVLKSKYFQKLFNGKPLLIIENGKINQDIMRKSRLGISDLLALLRTKNIFDINDVAYAILETNGDLNVIQKLPQQLLKRKDLNLNNDNSALKMPIISDGKINKYAADYFNLNSCQIKNILGTTQISDVFLMTYDKYGHTDVILKEKNK